MIGERPAYALFSRFGLELEYMLVANESLDVRAVVDELFRRATGELASDVERGDITWSNELVAHVIELKTTDPAPQLSGLAAKFHRQVTEINTLAGELGARLMPTAMHPWMQPRAETRLWPHDNSEVYQAFDRVFQCQGHGWANLQSTHLNLPFANDAEFGRLHAAIRLVLPLLPALAASSPICEGQAAGLLDARLDAYRNNARRIPSVTGEVVPEAVFTPAAYRAEILEPLYADIRPHDPGGVLQHEWLNARGAIARFERNTIEIRVLDVQEHPAADLAIAVLVVAVLQALVAERWTSLVEQQQAATESLAEVLRMTTGTAEATPLAPEYLRHFGASSGDCRTAGELWGRLRSELDPPELAAERPLATALDVILQQGPLARRILRAWDRPTTPEQLREVYRELCACLAENRPFINPAVE